MEENSLMQLMSELSQGRDPAGFKQGRTGGDGVIRGCLGCLILGERRQGLGDLPPGTSGGQK